MTMICRTEELDSVLYPTSDGINCRLKKIRRNHINFLYAYEKMPLGEDIGPLEPYQDMSDLYNEFRGVFIKPLLCGYLAVKHGLDLALELLLLAINTMTYSPEKISESFTNTLIEALYVTGYLANSAITAATVVPVFLIRFLATFANALVQFATPTAQYALIYHDYKQSQQATVNFRKPDIVSIANAIPINEAPSAPYETTHHNHI